jgi:hypothetical protein
LVQAIFEQRVAEMEPRRREMLQAAEGAGLLNDARTLVDMIMLPHLDLVDDDGQHPYASFLNQYLARYRPMGIMHSADRPYAHSEALREIYRLLRQRVYYIPEPVRERRINICTHMFINLLVENDNASERVGEALWQAQVRDTLDVMAVAICAPFSQPAPWAGENGLAVDLGPLPERKA